MDTNLLAKLIIAEINKDFEIHRLSGNLVNTITVEYDDKGDISIKIPAAMYDIDLWKSKKVIQYTGEGSYASEVNKNNKNHKSFVQRAIRNAIRLYQEQTGEIMEVE